jgi:ATP synthase F1 delta subunit
MLPRANMYGKETLYIRPYVNVLNKYYANSWKIEHLEKLEELQILLGPRHGALSYLRLDCIAEKRKYDIIMGALHSLQLEEMLKPIVFLLKKHKKLELLHAIISALVDSIKKKLRVEDITIYSACELAKDDQKKLETWIKDTYNAHIIRSHLVIEPQLIAGFRIEGSHFVADYSIQYQLHKLQHICNKEGLIS